MVAVKYNGQNYLLIDGVKFVGGINEIEDERFYILMKHPLFRARVESGILRVPEDFPLLNPDEKAKSVHPQPEGKEPHKKEDSDFLSCHEEHLGVKELLKIIHKCEDVQYLIILEEQDKRDKVKEACRERLEYLDKEDYKKGNNKEG